MIRSKREYRAQRLAEGEFLESLGKKKLAEHALSSVETAKWYAERRMPEEFGTRVKVAFESGERPLRVLIKKYPVTPKKGR